MFISSVYISGFRSLQNVETKLSKYTTLIGKNDSGKSSFLRALQLLFEPNPAFKTEDLCKFHSKDFYIEAVIENCSNKTLNIENGQVRIRRTFTNAQSQLFYWGKVPSSDTLKSMSEGNLLRGDFQKEQSLAEDVKKFATENLSEISPPGRVSPHAWHELFKRLDEKGYVEYTEGWRPLEVEVLSSLVQVVMLEADVRGEEEISGTSRSVLNQVGGILLRESTKNYPAIADAVGKLDEEIKRVATKNPEGKWILDELNSFESVLLEEVQRFDKTVTAQPILNPPRVPAVEFSINVKISDGLIEGLDKMGHGLRRSVVFAMLRTHRRLKEQRTQLKSKTDGQSPLYLFLVEEPELYLHPQAERRRMKELKELSNDENAQVVLCTHSAVFVDLTEYEGILRFNRPDRKATNVQGWKGQKFKPNDQKTLANTYRFDPNRSAMLFADLVILVEGQSEKVAIPHIAEKMNLDSPDKEVEVVDCGGNATIPVYQMVLEGFGIKYVAWLDSDDIEDVKSAKEVRTEQHGKIVLTENDWEKMSGIPAAKKSREKPYKSWKFFVFDDKEPNKKLKDRIEAAYSWRDFE